MAVSLELLALAWLALDDITIGSEPGHLLEWGIVAVTLGWFAALVVTRRQNVSPRLPGRAGGHSRNVDISARLFFSRAGTLQSSVGKPTTRIRYGRSN
jgi:hypothetical protein